MNSHREPLDFSSLPAVIQAMIEDNASTAAVIDDLIQEKGENKALASIIILDDMNIRGIQINSLYKMCNQSIHELYEKIINISKTDIDILNDKTFAICKYKAIFEGTKEDRKQHPDKYIFTDEERSGIRNKKSKERVHDILVNSSNKQKDLFPSITSKEAIAIINKFGFKCGYKKTYENKEGKRIIYRVFYNELGDIIYTNSMENPDIFLWGESKLKALRKSNNIENKECNTYLKDKNIKMYSIELRDNPFTTYKKILNKKEKTITDINSELYGNELIPIVESIDAIKYKTTNSDFIGCIISYIYSLLTFPETYFDLDEGLKRIYKPLLNHAEEKAYNEIIHQSSKNRNEIIQKLQNFLGINLDNDKLENAKENYNFNNKKIEYKKELKQNNVITKELSQKEVIITK